MADFIHLDAAVDTDLAEAYAMATVKVVDGDDTSDTLSGVGFHQWVEVLSVPESRQEAEGSFASCGSPPFSPHLPSLHIPSIPRSRIEIYARSMLLKQSPEAAAV
jgi:hypothetical protein